MPSVEKTIEALTKQILYHSEDGVTTNIQAALEMFELRLRAAYEDGYHKGVHEEQQKKVEVKRKMAELEAVRFTNDPTLTPRKRKAFNKEFRREVGKVGYKNQSVKSILRDDAA